MPEWFLYLPQSRMGIPDLVTRAQAAEASGFDGAAFLDHLDTPMAADKPIWEAMGVATWVAAKTDRLRIGHLVLCDSFRHPAVLAKQAVTLAEASGGRFELGLGSGSMPDELKKYDLGAENGVQRVARLERTLTALQEYWGVGESSQRTQTPTPSQRIPILLGGKGSRMLDLVRRYADWWNVAGGDIDRLPELLPSIGAARASVLQMVAFARRGSDRDAVLDTSRRRFGYLGKGLVGGDAAELADHFTGLAQHGVDRFYVWFSDAAPPESIAEFGESVISVVNR